MSDLANEANLASALSAPNLTRSFSGGTLASGPPDPTIAVGKTSVVTIENWSIKYYDKNGNGEGSANLSNFFSGASVGDPRVAYDSVNDRFVVTALAFSNAGAVTNSMPFAVSKDGNPNDGWYFGTISFPNASSLDYPSLTTDGNASYIQVRAFDSQSNYLGDYLAVVNNGLGTGGIYSGGVLTDTQYFAPTATGQKDFGEPVASFGGVSGSQSDFLYSGAGFGSAGGSWVYFTELQNPSSGHATFVQHVATGPGPAGGFVGSAPAQPGTSQPIVSEWGENAVYSGGFIYCVQPYYPASGSDANTMTVHWFKVDPSDWSIVDQGDVSGSQLGAGVATYDASIAADQEGDFAINFTASGPSLYAGSNYVVHEASDPLGTVSAPQVLQAGTAAYVIPSGSDNHWGDYERTMAADPSNPNTFWMFNEYATTPAADGTGQYGTWLGEFTVPSRHAPDDFNGDGLSDTLWRNTSTGDTETWFTNPSGGYNYASDGAPSPNWQIAGTGDFNGDGKADILWRNTQTDDTYLYLSNGAGGFTYEDLGTVGGGWQVVGVGNFTGSGLADILWQNSNGAAELWESNPSGGFNYASLGSAPGWQVASVGDFNGDGLSDILWRNASTGVTEAWMTKVSGGFTYANDGGPSLDWQIAGTGDFGGTSGGDVLWRNTQTGDAYLYLSNGSGGFNYKDLGVVSTSWQIAEIGNFSSNGMSDILWRNTATGDDEIWLTKSGGGFSYANVGNVPTNWKIVA